MQVILLEAYGVNNLQAQIDLYKSDIVSCSVVVTKNGYLATLVIKN